MKKLAIIFAAFIASTGNLHAADVSYDHVGLSFIQTKVDNTELDPDGVELHFSKLLTESVYIKALGNLTNASDGNIKLDRSVAELGVGYRVGVVNSVDIFSELSYLTISSKVKGSSSTSDEGYSLVLGSRMAFTHDLNADVLVRRSDFSDLDGFTEIGLNVRYAFESVDILSQISTSSDQKKWGIGFQYKF